MIPEAVFQQTLLGFLAPVARFLEDDEVSEVMINGASEVYIERHGKLELTDARFASEHALEAAVRNIAQYVGRSVSAERPVLDARLPDGSRVCAILPPAARRGIYISIRRFPKQRLTVEQLLRCGAITKECLQLLEACVLCRRNILVAGGTGSGKTSLLNALSSFVPHSERVVVIEDSSEVQLQQPHAVYLEARPPDVYERGAVSIRELLRATLRMRPDRIVVGECRGGEALDLIQAMTSGHGGSLSTVHATFPHDTLHHIETLCLMSDVELPLSALRSQIASAVNLIVQTSRMNDGSRKVTHVAECIGLDEDGGYALRMLYEWRQTGVDPHTAKVLGVLAWTGQQPSFADEVRQKGLSLPAEMSRMTAHARSALSLVGELRATLGNGERATFPLYPVADEIVAGRGSGCNWPLDETSLSRQHAKFRWDGRRLTVEDLGSANGTKLAGQPVRHQVPFEPDDVVQLGTVLIRFVLLTPLTPILDPAATLPPTPMLDSTATANPAATLPPAPMLDPAATLLSGSETHVALPDPGATLQSSTSAPGPVFYSERDRAFPRDPTRLWDSRAVLAAISREAIFSAGSPSVTRRGLFSVGAVALLAALVGAWQFRGPIQALLQTGSRAMIPATSQPTASPSPSLSPVAVAVAAASVIDLGSPRAARLDDVQDPDIDPAVDPVDSMGRGAELASAIAAYDQGRLDDALASFRRLSADPSDKAAQFMVELLTKRVRRPRP